MIPAEENLKQLLKDLERAQDALGYSYEKCRKIQMSDGLSYDEMESFEALTSRFARLSDIITQKVIRAFDILDLDDDGTVRDRINRAEKKGIIERADDFIDIRILRNEIAHEYKTEAIYSIFSKVLELTPILIKSMDSIMIYAKKYQEPNH
ncbi:MAG: hypothetical protein KKA54_13925 [Proteobacteria bacterium]|nr:hypothetical protein [Pseudomonadota bacterium]